MYILYSLKKSGCPAKLIKIAYFSFNRSILSYCAPVFVNVTSYLKQKFLRIERRASRIIGEEIQPVYEAAVEQQCAALFDQVLQDTAHSLRECFTLGLIAVYETHALSARQEQRHPVLLRLL